MDKLTKYLTEPFVIEEGVNDPGILKAVFLAGGPGSGKGYVGSGLFGIPKKVNVSAFGLKLVNQDKELVRMLNKYGFGTDLDDMPDELFRQLTDPTYSDYSGLRGRAKELTAARKKLYMDGRLGLIIDGTGHKFNKIKQQKMELEEIGYDCYMVFVHTDLEIAQQRNMERARKLNPELVQRSWNEVQRNKESFQGLFGNNNFQMVNNSDTLSEKAAQKKFSMLVKKGIGNFIRKPVKNFRGKKWIKKQQIMKEAIKLDVSVGDTILTGRFKNKKVKVKSIGKDEHGMPTINGKKITTFRMAKVNEAPRIPRKKGQPAGSKKHSDLYTDENPKGTIKGLKFATVKDAKASVSKIKSSGRSHAHKIQAAVAMEQRAREMGKASQAAVYRAYINKMKKKTKKKNEEFGAPAGMLPSPSRKMVKKMKRKGNTSVPYGSGYKKINENDKAELYKLYSKAMKMMPGSANQKKIKKQIDVLRKKLGMNEVQKTVTNKSFDKKRESGAWTVIGHMKKKGKSVFHVRDEKTKKRFDVRLIEQKEIKKTIGIFGGRFQPFHSGHLATYNWLKTKVDEVYITTSNIKQPPRHPMDFKEKVRHMVKMGIKKNRIVQEKTPYVAVNTLKKFNPETTAVVYAFGKKDAGRLKGGTKKSGGKTYYQDFNKNKNNLEGFEKHGYFITAPQFGSVSGTQMRRLLGDPKIEDKEREKSFKKVFGYFDKGIYNMMTNKFRKLFESYDLTDELIKEFLIEATGTPAGNLDDGPSTFYTDYNTYKKTSKEWLDSIYSDAGWKVVDYVLRDSASSTFKDEYRSVPLTYLDHGQAAGSTSAVTKYKKWMGEVIEPLGWEVVNWMGTTAAINNIIGSLFAAGADADEYTEEDFKLTEKINLDSEIKLLLEGGAYGHLNHPFDDKNLTFSDFKTLIINTLQGKLDSEGAVTEKTDGQNIMVSYKNGKLIAARNKGHIKNHGAGALDINGIKSMFAGRGDIEKAFVYAMRDLQRAVGGLSDAQKDKVFDEGKKFMSLEVIYPKTANVIPYDKSLLQFHGTIEYDSAGSPVGEDRGSARMLAGMIKQINQNVQKTYSITKPFVSNLPKVKDFSRRQSYFLGKLNRLQNRYGLKANNTLSDYHQAYWMEYIYNAGKQFKYNVPNNILVKLTRRWAFLDKSYKIQQIRKDIKNEKFLNWILRTDKKDLKGLQKKHIRDWEVLFFELGAEILSNLSDFIAANPNKAAQKIRNDLKKAVGKVRQSKDPKVLNTLKTQLDRLNAIGGLKSVVPSEGITFVFKGKLYKYTGAFAPANQILGMLKFV